MNLNLNTNINGVKRGLPYIKQAIDLFKRMTNPSVDEKVILDTYIRDLINYGIFDNADAIYEFSVTEENNTLLNIVKDAHNPTKINSPVYTKNKGWKGNKSDAAINTNYNATLSSLVGNNDFCFGGFFHNLYGLNLITIGVREGSNFYGAIENDSANKRRIYTGGSSTTPSDLNLLDSAFIMINISGGNVSIYRNGLLLTSEFAKASTLINYVFYLFAYNNEDTAAGFTDRKLTDVYFGKALTATKHLNLYNAIINKEYLIHGKRFNTDNFLSTFNKTSKSLHKLMVIGDSIMANETGGNVPVAYDEGDKYRPMRLTVNNIARRIYDKMSWNKATHVRLDATEWTKSGTWTVIDGERTVFEPSYSNEKYHQSIVNNSYIEITVPNGQDNFAFICMRDAGFDTLTVTLNGGDISAYGNSTVNCDRTRLTANEIGNAFHTEVYEGLPSGDNVIRITKGNNTNPALIWGGFYWTGNTLMVYNIAHGGKTMRRLYTDFLTPDFTENNPDVAVFEVTLINELSQDDAYDNSFVYFENIIENTFSGIDYLIIEPNPLGKHPITEHNYYADFTDPNQEQTSWVMRTYAWQKDYVFHNTFQYFKEQIQRDGGTLEGGQGGLSYTSDGVHLNEAGNNLIWSTMEDLFELS